MAGFSDFLRDIGLSVSAPERLLGGAAETLGTLLDPTFKKAIFSPQELSLGEAQQIMQFKPRPLTSEEFKRTEREGGLMTGLRGAAGLGEQALTFGTPTGMGGQALTGTLGNILSSPIQRGGIEGALAAFGAGGGGLETAMGAGLGAGGGAVGQAIGKGLGKLGEGFDVGPTKVGGFLQEKGESAQLNALKRFVGMKPSKKEGGIGLLKDVMSASKKAGMDIGSPDDALLLSADLFDNWGGVVRDEATKLTQQGKKINAQEILDSLLKKRKSVLSSEKGAIDNVINDITQWIGQNGDDVLSGYSLKQLIGSKGKWASPFDTSVTPASKAAYEDAYKILNNQFENLIGGKFRKANKNVELALNIKNWAGRAENSVIPAGINWSDPIQDLGIAGTVLGALGGAPVAGGLAGLGTAGAAQLAQSPKGSQAIGGLLQQLGQGQIPGVPGLAGKGEQLSQILGRGGIQVGQGLQGLMDGGQPQDTLQTQQMPQQGIGDILGTQAGGGQAPVGLDQALAGGGVPSGGMPQQQQQMPQQGAFNQATIDKLSQLALLQNAGVPAQQLTPLLMEAILGGGADQDVQSYSQGVERGLIDIGKVPKDIQGSVLQDLLGRGVQIPTAEGKITEAQRTFSSVQQGAQEALNLVEQGVKTGPLSTILGKAGEKVGVAGAGTDLRALLSNLNSMLKSEIFGASVSPQEMKSLQDSVPSPTDQESVIKTKLKRLIQRMETMR